MDSLRFFGVFLAALLLCSAAGATPDARQDEQDRSCIARTKGEIGAAIIESLWAQPEVLVVSWAEAEAKGYLEHSAGVECETKAAVAAITSGCASDHRSDGVPGAGRGTSGLEGPVMLDVGASEGLWMAPALAAGARVLAFEPHPASYGALERRYEGDERVGVREYAIGDEDGVETPFFSYGPWTVFTGDLCEGQWHEDHDGGRKGFSWGRTAECNEPTFYRQLSEQSRLGSRNLAFEGLLNRSGQVLQP